MKKKIENKNQEVLTYAERSQAMSKEAQAEKIEDILKRYDSAEAKIKDMKSVTIEAANECRAVGIELQALCGHEQINFEFWKNNCAKLNKKFDLNNAKIFIAIARKMPKSAKTIAEAAPLTQLIYQAVDLLQLAQREEQQHSFGVSIVEKFLAQATCIRQPFQKALREFPMAQWKASQLDSFLSTTEWLDIARQEAMKLRGEEFKK